MRKTLACCCVAVSVIIGIFLDHIAMLIVHRTINTKLALLMFVPFFIGMYWLGTFFEQLIVKDGEPIFKKIIVRILRGVYVVSVLSVCVIWLWVLYRHTYLIGELVGRIKGYFG